MRALILRRLAVCSLVLICACGGSPTAPGVTDSAGHTSDTTVTVIDGRSHAPVVGALVTVIGLQFVTDASGRVRFPATKSNCVSMELMATGYLERHTCAPPSTEPVALWPIASAEEAEATRTWIFTRDRILAEFWSFPTAIALSPELAARSDVAATWADATNAITQVSQGRIKFQWMRSVPEEGLLIEAAAATPSCSRVPPWPFEVGGFCVSIDPAIYFLDRVNVRSDLLTDRSTALRAVLTSVGIKVHTLPGLLNMTRPEPELTEFERKTLGMLGLRQRTVIWPDFDQIQ